MCTAPTVTSALFAVGVYDCAHARRRLRRQFRLRSALSAPLGTKRGRGRGAAIDSVLTAVDTFYGEVLQSLKAWTAAPPKLREPAELPPTTPAALVSTALSSQDGVGAAGQPANEQPSTDNGDNAEVAAAIDAESRRYRLRVSSVPEGYEPPFPVYAVERTDPSGDTPAGQVGAFTSLEEAEKLWSRLDAEGETVVINGIPVHRRLEDYEHDR